MSAPNELRVFISSTFRDLQDEREHLVKKIFPEIRAICRERGVTFTEIDLRWGITEEEAEREGIIRICLNEIDRCRPYFIGILGERYGWTPTRPEAERLADDFPALADAVLHGASITEMEIVHGVLANPAMAGRAFFYFRDPAATPTDSVDAISVNRLDDLKQHIRSSGCPVRENFASAAVLGEWLRDDLIGVLEQVHPVSQTPSALELERRAHSAFAASRRRAYIPNPLYLQRFNEWIDCALEGGSSIPTVPPSSGSESPIRSPLVVSGEAGFGKSSLIAYLVDDYRTRRPAAFLIEHYVGTSQQSGSSVTVMRHVIEEIRERFAIDEPVAEKPEEITRSFPNWLFRLDYLAKLHGVDVLIAIDALNQLDEAGRRLTWLPKSIPAALRLMISMTSGEMIQLVTERGWNSLHVLPEEDEVVRQSIVARYLAEFRKKVSTDQLQRLTQDHKASSPLYLRVVAEELRLHGQHETLDEEIVRYSSASDLDEVFQRVLDRLERDFDATDVRAVMESIWASRSGMSELELIGVAGLTRLQLSRLLLALDYHLVRKDGLLGFFHDYLRRAVEKRYLPDHARRHHVRYVLTQHFEGVDLSSRTALELVWQYRETSDDDRLAGVLARPEVVALLNTGESQWELQESWAHLINHGVDVEATYRASLDIWRPGKSVADRAQALLGVAGLLYALSCWRMAAEVYDDLARLGVETGERAWELAGHNGLGRIRMALGDYSTAFDHIEQAYHLAEASDNRANMAGALGMMASVRGYQGRYDEALEYSRRCRVISQEVDDRRSMSIAIRNMGLVHFYKGRYAEALDAYGQALTLIEEMGDRSGMASLLGNMGVVYKNQAQFDEALACYRRQYELSEALGDRRGMGNAIGTMGNLHEAQGRHADAMECYQRAIVEHRAIGFLYGVVFWLQGITWILLEAALEGGAEPEYLFEIIGKQQDVQWVTVALCAARTSGEEFRALSQELSMSDMLFISNIFLSRIDAATGSVERAIEQLGELLAHATENEQRAEVHYWLWMIGERDHGAPALALYEALYASNPKPDYSKRIEELGAAGERS